MHKRLTKVLRYWTPLAVIITALIGFTHVAVQQNYRQNANDPQIQIAEDSVSDLNMGANASSLNSSRKIDINLSLSPFLIVFDKNGKFVASNAILDGKTPIPPQGVFDFVKSGGTSNLGSIKKQIIYSLQGGLTQNRFTWQPKKEVRIAAVITKYNGGFILVGRNLREVEKREDALTWMTFLAWVSTLGASFITAFLLL